jgi:Concanavalin A-like lectin/glucanases superfamily
MLPPMGLGPGRRGGLFAAVALLTVGCTLVESLNGLSGEGGADDAPTYEAGAAPDALHDATPPTDDTGTPGDAGPGTVDATSDAPLDAPDAASDATADSSAPVDARADVTTADAPDDAPVATDSATTHDAPVDAPPDVASDAPPTSVYRAAVLQDTPVAYWRLDEKTGSVAHDETGHGYSGAYSASCVLGATGALAGDPDTALQLDGTGCVVDVGDLFDFAGQAPFSLEMWARPAVIDSVYRHIVSKMQYTAGGSPLTGTYVFVEQGSTTLGFERWSDGGAVLAVETTDVQPAGSWSYIVVTYDGTNGTIYVNGQVALVGQSIGGVLANGVDFLWGQAFDGVLDEPAVYDHALTATRVQAHWMAAQ